MKNSAENNRFMTIKAGFEGKGTSLYLDIPERLYSDFTNCFENKKSEQVLGELYDEYLTLSEYQKSFLQMSIYGFADKIINVADLVNMIRAIKKVIPLKCGC